ncbi:MAG: M18 family aminopeptidase [Gammaproteobacteria bacterium]|nr:M18 family aminopeptidase [Gammaproteobacteria bacterium]
MTPLNSKLLDFLHHSSTPFHAVVRLGAELQQAGYQRLHEGDRWNIKPAGKYYVTRGESSLCAFALGTSSAVDSGVRIVGAHTDSPCLKIKPQPDLHRKGYYQLGVEPYGGVLLNPWFDRELAIAGRVSYLDNNGQMAATLIDFARPVAVIPSLAIHLDPDSNKNRSVNAQTDIVPLLLTTDSDIKYDLRKLLLAQMQQQQITPHAVEILDYDLFLYDCQPPNIIGLNGDFIAGARLDNLLSCYVGLQGLLAADNDVTTRLLICSDHEEVGSTSHAGAKGTFLAATLERIAGTREDLTRMCSRSLMISADNAHGVHPNYSSKHDDNHGPVLNGGPVIKVNANQRYATSGDTAAFFRYLCRKADIPVQSFVTRSDMGCGSTIGPLTAAKIGVRTLDVGVPTFAMHSIRELAGSRDTDYLQRVLTEFYRSAVVS